MCGLRVLPKGNPPVKVGVERTGGSRKKRQTHLAPKQKFSETWRQTNFGPMTCLGFEVSHLIPRCLHDLRGLCGSVPKGNPEAGHLLLWVSLWHHSIMLYGSLWRAMAGGACRRVGAHGAGHPYLPMGSEQFATNPEETPDVGPAFA